MAKADRIDNQCRAVAPCNDVIGFDRIGQTKAVLETGTAAAVDRQPQYRGFAQLGCNFGNAARSIFCHGNDLLVGHMSNVATGEHKEKGR